MSSLFLPLALGTVLLAWGGLSPMASVFMVSMLAFFFINSHLGMILIQLEVLALLAVSVNLWVVANAFECPLFLFTILCFIVSEAALGLSLLVVNSRTVSGELQKFSY